jgi:flagellar motor switch protein FliM
MEKILTQEEIDALFRATQQGQIPAGGAKAKQKNISNFDIRVGGQISKAQARALSTLPGAVSLDPSAVLKCL